MQVHFGAVSIVQPYINSGRMRALGVPGASARRSCRNVPTMAEAGVPGFEWQTWASLVAPGGYAQADRRSPERELVKAVSSPDVREKLIAQGLEPIGSPPETVTKWTQDGLKRMHDIVQRANIHAE